MQASVRRLDNAIVQYGDALAARPGCDIVDLTADQASAVIAQAGADSGLLLNSDGTISAYHAPLVAPTLDLALLTDIQTCKAFLANTTPVAAEVVQAEKALIRVVGRIVRALS